MRLGDLDDLKVHISELLLVYSGEELVTAILNAIDNAPTVEPKKGEWITDKSGDHFCSECRKSALYHEIGVKIESRFCPYCGASMKGGAETVKIKSTKDLINNIAGFDVSGIKPLPEYKESAGENRAPADKDMQKGGAE